MVTHFLYLSRKIEMKLEFETKEQMIDWFTAFHDYFKEDETKKESKIDYLNRLKEKYPICIDRQVEDVKNSVFDYINVMELSLK